MRTFSQRIHVHTPVAFPPAHLGLRWETLKAVHAPEVSTLLRDAQKRDGAQIYTSDEAIANMVEKNHGQNRIQSIVGIDPAENIQAVATVTVPTGAQQSILVKVEATVAPAWRGRGIGRMLLVWQDQTARELLLEEYGPQCELPVTIAGVVPSADPSASSIYISQGYTPQRTFDVMYADLRYPIVKYPLAEGYTYAPWPTGAMLEDVKQLHLGAFQDHWGSRGQNIEWWETALATLDPRWSAIVTDTAGNLAGYCAVSRPVTKWMLSGKKELYAELIGVGTEHRGKGIARALLSRAVAAAAEAGMDRFGLDVDVDNPSAAGQIYAAIGFEPAYSFTYFTVEI